METFSAGTMRVFTKEFCPVEDPSEEKILKQFQNDILAMNLNDVADQKTEVPVRAFVFFIAMSHVSEIAGNSAYLRASLQGDSRRFPILQ